MGTRSRGRGTAGAFGFLLLIAGLVGGGVLYVLSLQRPDKAVEGFARAAAGCTTTLDFSETGTFYVYEEAAGDFTVPEGGCVPTASVGERFTFLLTGPATVTTAADATVVYDSGDFAGTSVARFEIDTPGLYEIAVVSEDVGSVAAVGRDPDSGVADQQRTAIIVGAAGALLGLLLLILAGRRSRRASTVSAPEGPVRPSQPVDSGVPDWPPSAPAMPRVPINPQQPDSPVEVTPPPPPLPAREPGAGAPRPPWNPPPAGDRPVSSEPPAPPPPVRTPQPIPVLPAAPASVSGAWPPSAAPPPPPPPPAPASSRPPPPPPPR